MKIIDMHAHIDCSSLEAAQKAIQDYSQIMQEYKITQAIFMPNSTHQDADFFGELKILTQALEKEKNLAFYATANIDVEGYRYSDLCFLEKLIQNNKVKALKLYPGYCPYSPEDGRCHVFYKMAEQFELPVMIHTGELWREEKGLIQYSHPFNIDKIALLFPHVNFILCHLGNPYFTDTKLIIYKNHNCFADGSGLFYQLDHPYTQTLNNEIFNVFAYQEEPKILFGTDFPFTSAPDHLIFWQNFFQTHPFFQPNSNSFFYKLAEKIFHLKDGSFISS